MNCFPTVITATDEKIKRLVPITSLDNATVQRPSYGNSWFESKQDAKAA